MNYNYRGSSTSFADNSMIYRRTLMTSEGCDVSQLHKQQTGRFWCWSLSRFGWRNVRRKFCHSVIGPILRILWDQRLGFGRRSFSVAAPMVWNSFPDSLRDPTLSIDNFRSTLKTHLLLTTLEATRNALYKSTATTTRETPINYVMHL